MNTVKFEARWETIYQYIGRALFEATEKNRILECEFNGGVFIVTPKSTMDSAFADWQNAMNKQEEEYKKSDAYKELQREQAEKTERLNKEVAILFGQFRHMELQPTTFEGMLNVLNWLVQYQKYSDNTLCTSSDDAHVIKILEENGYVKDMWVGAPKDTFNDMTCYFEYIVGQAMSTMEFLALHPSILTFRDKWFKKFAKTKGVTV